MKAWLIAGALAASLPVTGAQAASFLDRPYGTLVAGASPRARALGGAGAALAQGVHGLSDNPATLTFERGSRLSLTGTMLRTSENRFVPLFDTFDSYVDETAIAINDATFYALNGGVTLDRWGKNGPVLAAAIFDRLDPRYHYFDERRSTATTDQVVAHRYIDTEGVLRALAAGVAMPLSDGDASVGVALNYYFGTITDRDATVPYGPGSTATPVDTMVERRLAGYSLSFGVAARAGERLSMGMAVETPPVLDDEYTLWRDGVALSPPGASGELALPMRFQVGVAYRPRNSLETTFVMDAVFQPWSRVRDELRPEVELENVWETRFGVEHVFYNDLPARFGFRYASSYTAEEADRATLTLGMGYRADRFRIEAAGEVGKRISRQQPLWPREEQGPAVGLGRDRVEDTSVQLTLGADYRF
jgi:hypothetical protein